VLNVIFSGRKSREFPPLFPVLSGISRGQHVFGGRSQHNGQFECVVFGSSIDQSFGCGIGRIERLRMDSLRLCDNGPGTACGSYCRKHRQ